MTSVRAVRPWELSRLVGIAHSFFLEANLGSEFDGDHLLRTLQDLREQRRLVAFVLVKEELVVGCIVGCTGQQMMSKAILLEELFWYVEPHSRGGTGGIRLLNMFIEHSRQHCDGVVMARLSAGQAKLHDYYGKLNFKEIETHYLKLWPQPPQQ